MIFSFVIYLFAVLVVGVVSTRQANSTDEFFLAGRKIHPVAVSLSAEATSMSGWLLLGLPGELFRVGLSAAWAAVGCILGDYVNWRFMAHKIREKTEKIGAITLSELLSNQEQSRMAALVRVISGMAVVFFMTLYLWAQFVATGKALSGSFADTFSYESAVLIGAFVIIAYTACGGMISVIWTDVLQAILMVITLIGLPIYALWLVIYNGQIEAMLNTPSISSSSHTIMDLWGGSAGLAIVFLLISNLGIGAGYIGQPQIASRFMSIRSSDEISIARRVGIAWVIASCIGVVILSLCAHILLPTPSADPEQVILEMASYLLPNWLSGIIIAAVLAAIMSSADSFLIAAVASIQKDFVSGSISLKISRSSTLFLGVLAALLAMGTDPTNPDTTVFQLAVYAWGGLAIVFGIPSGYTIYATSPHTRITLITMISGLLAMAAWHISGLSKSVYEVIPCMIIQIFVCVSLTVMSSKSNQTL